MKQYDKEFKLHAVQLVSECGKPASQVARELGVSQKTLYGWMSRYKEDPSTPFVGSVNLKPDAKALQYLERVSQSDQTRCTWRTLPTFRRMRAGSTWPA
nr:transposase [Bacilli bacterium]